VVLINVAFAHPVYLLLFWDMFQGLANGSLHKSVGRKAEIVVN